MSPAEALEALALRELTAKEATALFRRLASGGMDDIQAAALLAAIKTRGESDQVLLGAAEALLEAAVPFPPPAGRHADCCGTGGDGMGTINISTAVAFVAAEAGVPVAKHGNRAVSSRCGSADLLEALGVRIEMPRERALACLEQCGVTYLHAPIYHPAVGKIAAVRRALGTRTIFNLLGPLLNPARPPIRLIGVYSGSLVLPMARALAGLGCEAGLVVHGSGLDEIALHGPTTAARVEDGQVTSLTLTPREAGLRSAPLQALQGGGPEESARWLAELLAGEGASEHMAAVAINTGALLWIAGKASGLREGSRMALEILRSGRARPRLDSLAETSRGS